MTKYFCLPGKHFLYGEMEFWAQGGMVHVYDHRDNSCTSVAPREWMKRAHSIGKIINEERFGDDRLAKTNLCWNMKRAADEAFFQGDPTDRKVMEWRLRQRNLSWVLGSTSSPPPLTVMTRDGPATLGAPSLIGGQRKILT